MTSAQLEIQIIGAVVAVACALPGVYLMLRRMALMSDVISHAILPGIVIAFFLTEDLSSPWLILAAAATGMLTVVLVELLERTQLVKEDAAMGLVFPALFSLGVILISRYAGDVHLDVDAVLLGELAFAPFNRFEVMGTDIGPKALYVMSGVLLLNLTFIFLFYKELKLATFDAALAATLGFAPAAMHYALMTLVSITAVGAFDAVGSILVVALMIGPPASAYLLTNRLNVLLGLSALFGVICAIGGYWLAHLFDASIAGAMATLTGILFTIVFFAAPDQGVVAVMRRRVRQRWTFAQQMLVIHLFNHEGTPDEALESRVDHLQAHLRWTPEFAAQVVRQAERKELVDRHVGRLMLTSEGRGLAQEALTNE